MNIRDREGTEIGPILQRHADAQEIPLVLLLACGIAESGLDRWAFRDGVWPDVSCGPFQQTVAYAASFGIGDGTNTPANIAVCRQAFSDWETATRIAAMHLRWGLIGAKQRFPSLRGDDLLLAALGDYNSGSPKGPGDWWWTSWQAENYRRALMRAKETLGI